MEPAAHPKETHHAVPERLPLREEVLWLHCCRGLSLRSRMQVREELRVRRRLRLRAGEVTELEGARVSPSPAPQVSCVQPVEPGSPHVQSMQPCSAQDPHHRTTRFRSVSRARNSRTAALFGVMPASEA